MSPGVNKGAWPGRVLPFLIICLPYVYYLVDQNMSTVEPLVADSFRYQWTSVFSPDIFLGGSVSFRLLNFVSGNDSTMVINLVLMVYLLAEVLLFLAIRTHNLVMDVVLVLGIAFMFDSNFLVGIHQRISPEGFFIAMQLLFVAAFFLARGKLSDYLIFPIAIVFIFSRNVAPYIALGTVLVGFVLNWRERPLLSFLTLVLPIAVISLASANFTRNNDTSLEMNTANNMISRVTSDAERMAFFRVRYAIPTGPWVDACQNHELPNAAVACFEHRELTTANLSRHDYELRTDDSGLSDWIQTAGTGAWQRYILVDRPLETARIFAEGFQENFENPFSATNGRIVPLNYFDISRNVAGIVGLSSLWALMAIMVAAGLYCLWRPASNTMRISVVLMAGSIANIFVSYFGDGMEIGRHTYPGYATLGVALGLLFLSLLQEVIMPLLNIRLRGPADSGENYG